MTILWGIAHVAPTRSVVRGFGPISTDSKRLITMTWVGEGVAPSSVIVVRACAAMLLITAVWTGFTSTRTPVLPMKLCPLVKTTVGVVFL